jgi:hypothetical protein
MNEAAGLDEQEKLRVSPCAFSSLFLTPRLQSGVARQSSDSAVLTASMKVGENPSTPFDQAFTTLGWPVEDEIPFPFLGLVAFCETITVLRKIS